LLADTQADLTSTELAWHYRSVQRVLTRDGAQKAANFVVDFDPAYQRLEIHFVSVLRKDERLEHAAVQGLQVFRRESDLERLVLNGRLTASLLIPDVRVDDIVEIALTIYGSNPILRGQFSVWAGFDFFGPWFDCRYRQLRPLDREIAVRPFNDPPECSVTVEARVEDKRWRVVASKKVQPEIATPPWAVLIPAIQFSEFMSWNEVATLFVSHYDDVEVPESLAREIDQLAATSEDPAHRAVEWLRFVQQRLRYFALSLGEGGLVPRELDEICDSRFGDCKDAARLYVAGARRLGLDACAALVSTQYGPALPDFLATPNLFNHCIVRLRLNGKSYWLDPTLSQQMGNLENIYFPHTGWALPLTSEAVELEDLCNNKIIQLINVEDEIVFGKTKKSPAELTRKIWYYSGYANSVRNGLANQGAAKFSLEMLGQLRRIWPDISETAPAIVHDDEKRNSIAATLKYEIQNCWNPNGQGPRLGFKGADLTTATELAPLNGAQRQAAIFLGRPRKITYRLKMEMPRRWYGKGWHHEVRTAGVRFVSDLTIFERAIVCSREIVVSAWSMPNNEAQEYGKLVSKLHENIINIWSRERLGRIGSASGGALGVFGWKIIYYIVWGSFVAAYITSIIQKL
jgi:hypothetical protein